MGAKMLPPGGGVRRPRRGWRGGWWLVVLAGAGLLAVPAPSARAQRKPLDREEQNAVNQAIDRGVEFLKKTQLPTGTWPDLSKTPPAAPSHQVGYAALAGLTLLECDVPADDPAVQRAARFVRARARKLDATYEIALSILFLDRLGDPRDERLIQVLAVRLVAGQTPTGGWGYKCPVPDGGVHRDLLTALRKLPPLKPPDLVVMKPGGKEGPGGGPAEKRPGERGPAGGPLDKRGRPPGGGAVLPGGGGPGGGSVEKPGEHTTPGGGSAERPPSGSEYPAGSTIDREPGSRGGGTLPLPGGPGGGKTEPPPPRVTSRQWLGCIKASEGVPDETPAAKPKERAEAGKPDKPDKPEKEEKPYVLPARIRRLPVFQDPRLLPMRDPPNRASEPLLATTDNSNSQFALLAVWRAQRHGVPMDRTLRLIAHRYQTSQNRDGSWGYHYQFGGGEPERHTMTCVGLLGLAVGLGMAEKVEGKAVRDPAVLSGFVALSKHVGKPEGRMQNLPPENLYFLWSLERVAVLYRLPTVGEKDWYRWGAEKLVANQGPLGNWANGGYHGATPVIDTCMALLFLKRANFVEDLAARLPIDPRDLAKDIHKKTAKPPGGKKEDKQPAPAPESVPSTGKPPGDGTAGPEQPALSPLPIEGKPEGATEQDQENRGTGKRTLLIVLFLVFAALVVAGFGIGLALYLRSGRQDEVEEDGPPPRPRGGGRRPVRRARTR